MKGIWKYSDWLPHVPDVHRVTLGEGNTPLVRSRNIGPSLGMRELYFKLEITNPTGSYKDRFAAAALSSLSAGGARECFATSSGNTGAALAAFSAAVGLRCFLIIVDGAPEGKLSQMEVYGAETLMIRDFGKDVDVSQAVMEELNKLAESRNSPVQISAYKFSANGMAGVETIAYEIAEKLSDDMHVFVPAGGGGLTLAVIRGFRKWKETHTGYALPRIHCVQPRGNDTISGALLGERSAATAIAASTTTISGLQVPNVLDGDAVIEGCRASQGGGHLVEDEEIYACQRELAVREGIFCEPAGAVALAGLKRAVRSGMLDKDDRAVCLVTGHGFKSMSTIGDSDRRRYFDAKNDALRHINERISTQANV